LESVSAEGAVVSIEAHPSEFPDVRRDSVQDFSEVADKLIHGDLEVSQLIQLFHAFDSVSEFDKQWRKPLEHFSGHT
jgi:hypothetical protein